MNLNKVIAYQACCLCPVLFALVTNSLLCIAFSLAFAMLMYIVISNTGSIKFRYKRILVVILRPERGFAL